MDIFIMQLSIQDPVWSTSILSSSLAESYRQSLLKLKSPDCYIQSAPRGLKIREVMNLSMTINPRLNLYSNCKRGSQLEYIAAELLWYFSRSNTIEYISKYASFWKNITNTDGTVNSAYGNLIFRPHYDLTQWQWSFNQLITDKDTRQAVIHFNMPMHQYTENKDFVCTMYGIFHIRDNKLYFTIRMRSNDAILGTCTDIAFFTCLQQQMLLQLKSYYPSLELGSYTHSADSYHVYERHFNLVNLMLKSEFIPSSLPEMKISFINGNEPSTEFLTLYKACVNGDKSYKSECPLMTWIHRQLVLNKE